MSAPVTVCCAVPSARCAVVWPSAVTTTASRDVATRRSCTLMTFSAPTVRSVGAVPMKRNCSTCPAATRIGVVPGRVGQRAGGRALDDDRDAGDGDARFIGHLAGDGLLLRERAQRTRKIPINAMRILLFMRGVPVVDSGSGSECGREIGVTFVRPEVGNSGCNPSEEGSVVPSSDEAATSDASAGIGPTREGRSSSECARLRASNVVAGAGTGATVP